MELDKLIEQFRKERLQEPTQYIEPSDIEEEEVVNPSFMNMNENIEGEI